MNKYKTKKATPISFSEDGFIGACVARYHEKYAAELLISGLDRKIRSKIRLVSRKLAEKIVKDMQLRVIVKGNTKINRTEMTVALKATKK